MYTVKWKWKSIIKTAKSCFGFWCLHDNYFQKPKQNTSSQTQMIDVEPTFSLSQIQKRVSKHVYQTGTQSFEFILFFKTIWICDRVIY